MKSSACILCFRPTTISHRQFIIRRQRSLFKRSVVIWNSLFQTGFTFRVATTWRGNLIQFPPAKRSLITFHLRWALNKRRCMPFKCSSLFCLIAFYWSHDPSMHLAILIFLHLCRRNCFVFIGHSQPRWTPLLNRRLSLTDHSLFIAVLPRVQMLHTLHVTRKCGNAYFAQRLVIFYCAGTSIASISMLVRSSCLIETVDKKDLICFLFFFILPQSYVYQRRQRNSSTKENTNWQTECWECVQLWLEPPFYYVTHKVTAYDISHKQQKWGY